MNSHLTSEQMECALCGEVSEEVAQHLSGCEQCSDDVATLRRAFGNFREAATATAEHHRLFVPTVRVRRVPRMAWGFAAAALFVSVAAPLVVHRHPAVVVDGSTPQVVATTMSDEALLSNVQDDLSSSVPESLLPLASASSSSTNSTKPQRKN